MQQYTVLLMMGAVAPETCSVTLQWNKSDCILLHLVGLLFNVNYDARNHELKKKLWKVKISRFYKTFFLHPIVYNVSDTLHLYVAVCLPLQNIVTDLRRQSEGSRDEILRWLRFYIAWLFSPLRNWSVNWNSAVGVKSIRQIINCHQPL